MVMLSLTMAMLERMMPDAGSDDAHEDTTVIVVGLSSMSQHIDARDHADVIGAVLHESQKEL